MFISVNMKKIMALAIGILFFLFSQIAWSWGIIGSPHDFRKYPLDRSGEICLPCHVPQKTMTLPDPLWNLNLATQTYIMYGRTFHPAEGKVENSHPDGITKKCLSCHDGIIAPEAYGSNTGGLSFRFDRDFTGIIPDNNHPVSFIYDTALVAKYSDLYDPSTRLSGVAGSSGTISADMLFSNRVECSSCHDVHNTRAVPGTKLLVKDSAGSVLCLTCHNK